jgi:hypothetical protein
MPIGAGGAVTYPKKRMTVEERMVEQQLCRRFKQRAGFGASFWQRTLELERVANGRRRFIVCHRPARHRLQKLRKMVNESMPDSAERRRVHRER